MKELEIMKICSQNNKNSVKYYEYFHMKENFVIIMELCDENLSQIIKNELIKIEEDLIQEKYVR